MSDVHGEIASMKGDLQRLGPPEEKVDSMLKKLSLLETQRGWSRCCRNWKT